MVKKTLIENTESLNNGRALAELWQSSALFKNTMRGDIKLKKYIAFNIIIPMILIFILPIIIFIFAIQYFSISEINLLFLTLEINSNIDIPNYISNLSIFTTIVVLFSVIFIALRNFNKNRILMSGNLYGTGYYIFYRLAKFLGFSKISLIRKPYYIIFKIVMDNKFEELVNLEKENEQLSSDISIKVDESKFHNINNLRECNLVISDTYKINLEQLPEDKQDFDTIVIERIGHEKIRISSPELVNEVRNAVIKIMSTGAKINLFMTTSTYNTYKIITNCFMQADRDKMEVDIFQQDTSDKKKRFKDKGKNVLRRKQ